MTKRRRAGVYAKCLPSTKPFRRRGYVARADGYLAGFSGFTNARSDLAEKFEERVLLATERSEQIRKIIIEKGEGTG